MLNNFCRSLPEYQTEGLNSSTYLCLYASLPSFKLSMLFLNENSLSSKQSNFCLKDANCFCQVVFHFEIFQLY